MFRNQAYYYECLSRACQADYPYVAPPTPPHKKMTLTLSKDHNPNYIAEVIKLPAPRKHSNADRLQCVSIFANNVITGLDAKEGDLYVYFPLESQLSTEFLSETNSFEDPTKNKDTTKKNFFNKHGRVRAISLRGEKSEGYIVPVGVVQDFAKNVLSISVSLTEGVKFDSIGDHLFIKKYIPANTRIQGDPNKKKTKGNIKKYVSKLVENQFNFHTDTSHLKRNAHRINPDSRIAITNKLHGTSFVVSNVLVKKKLGLIDSIAKFLGANVAETEYGMLYSSRCVIKNQNFDDINKGPGFYDANIWEVVAKELYPNLKAGISVYGEIVGYLSTGKMIQPKYDYGCEFGKHDVYVYKITSTNVNGDVVEFTHDQVKNWCAKYGVKMVQEYYIGKAKDLFPELDVAEHWNENFLNKMIDKYLEKDCDLCKSEPNLPSEGVVLKIDDAPDIDAFKLKSFRFLQHETDALDKGEIDIETAETTTVAEEV